MTITVFKSSDSGAPVLTGAGAIAGQTYPDLANLLRQCLVNGYGAFATGTITSNNTNVSDGDTVTVGSRTYTFRNAPSTGYEVQIGGNADASLTSLQKAITGTGVSGTDYAHGTYANPDCGCTGPVAHVLTVSALLSGTAGNSLALAKSATTLTVSGATLAGGTITKAAAGWSCPYMQNNTPLFHPGTAPAPTQNAASAGPVNHSLSSSLSKFDVIILVVCIYDATNGATTTVTTPAGWTRLVNAQHFGRVVAATPGESMYVFAKIAAAGDISAAVGLSASASCSWQISSFGVSSADLSGMPISVSSQAASAATISGPSAAVNDTPSFVISIAAVNSAASLTDTVPSGYTSRASNNYVAGANEIFIATKDTVASGSTGALVHTPSGTPANTSAMATLVIKGLPNSQIVLRPGSGVQHYFHVDDSSLQASGSSGGPAGQEAQFRGSEAASGFQAGITGYFPTAAQFPLNTGLVQRRSTTLDNVARTWLLIADDRTAWFFARTGDASTDYMSMGIGEFYSILTGTDSYRSFVIGRTVANQNGSSASEVMGAHNNGLTTSGGHYLARPYTAVSGAVAFGKYGDSNRGAGTFGGGGLSVPNMADGTLHLSPVHIIDGVGVTIRGRLRGMYQLCHPQTSFTDGDTILGSGPYAGRTFLIVKSTASVSTQTMQAFDITGPWETN